MFGNIFYYKYCCCKILNYVYLLVDLYLHICYNRENSNNNEEG